MQQSCRQCKTSFEVTNDDLIFYDAVSPVFNGNKCSIAPPTLCPDCRMQRRMSWRNERSIYASTCARCKKRMISMYSSEKPLIAYCHECFWHDGCDARDCGIEIDFCRPFREQFVDLLSKTPLLALINTHAENSEYCHRIYDGRNNYLSFIALFAPENLLYTYYTQTCKDCTDVSVNHGCELCYETTDAERCYHCFFANRIRNCRDSLFLEDCMGCRDCFGCKNLHQKQYCIFNEQKTREEYEQFLGDCDRGSFSFVEAMLEKSQAFFRTLPNRALIAVNAENSTGSYLLNCRNIENGFDIYESEYLSNCSQVERSHHCRDCYGMSNGVFCYDATTMGHPSAERFAFCAAMLDGCSDCLYCCDCYAGTKNCFGCVGLKKGQYCILNRQYSKEEYERLAAQIIEQMRKTGEWSEFLPIEVSPFAYNETVAQDYFPLSEEEVRSHGWKWKEQIDEKPAVGKIIPAAQLPDSIDDASSQILDTAIECAVTKLPFRIIKQELDFLPPHKLPLPRLHPDERHRRRMFHRNPRKLWSRMCAKCGKEMQTTYPPGRPEIVYCEQCYLKNVY